MKKLAVMQPYLFPYLGYFQLLNAVDEYVVYDDVHFIKGGWINRNHILRNGEKQRFSIALSHASPNKLINEIDIAEDFGVFLKTVSHAYSRAPYRAPATELLTRICNFEEKNLSRFIFNSLLHIARYVGIDTKIIASSQIAKNNSLRAQEKLLQICERRNAGVYINAVGGRDLYAHEKFCEKGVQLQFLQPGDCRYQQFGNSFTPHLSIVDALMFNSPQEIRELLNDYTLS